MKSLLLYIALLAPLATTAQTNQGINFERGSSWQSIKDKAKTENKFIFVDCYATWCGPCRFMSDSVFSRKKVGDSINARFISVKVQMDTSKKDNDEVKRWYKDANYLMETYKVAGFPTYLFFAPDGQIVHKDAGAKGPKDFLRAAADATNPERQYYTLLRAYQNGQQGYETMPYLANKTQELGDEELAHQIAGNYIRNYLDKLNDREFLTKENLAFIGTFSRAISSKNKAFQFYYNRPAEVDSLMNIPGYARGFADYIITSEEVMPYIDSLEKTNTAPNWNKLTASIKSKYNTTYAARIVANTKVSWYREKKDWKNYTKYLVQKMEGEDVKTLPRGVGSILLLNNSAWEVFQYSNDAHELQKALSWIDAAIPMDPNNPAGMLDTKANILYKLGRKDEAISTQERAIALAPDADDMKETLKKMKKGSPTWPLYN